MSNMNTSERLRALLDFGLTADSAGEHEATEAADILADAHAELVEVIDAAEAVVQDDDGRARLKNALEALATKLPPRWSTYGARWG